MIQVSNTCKTCQVCVHGTYPTGCCAHRLLSTVFWLRNEPFVLLRHQVISASLHIDHRRVFDCGGVCNLLVAIHVCIEMHGTLGCTASDQAPLTPANQTHGLNTARASLDPPAHTWPSRSCSGLVCTSSALPVTWAAWPCCASSCSNIHASTKQQRFACRNADASAGTHRCAVTHVAGKTANRWC